jgi:hypothetical protein
VNSLFFRPSFSKEAFIQLTMTTTFFAITSSPLHPLFQLQNYDEAKNVLQDIFTDVCSNCGTWAAIRGDWRKCYIGGIIRPQEECDITWNPSFV